MKKNYQLTEELLIIPYVLLSAGIPLSEIQIHLILYVSTNLNYFDMKEDLIHLQENGLLYVFTRPTGEYLALTIKGKKTITDLTHIIRFSVREKIDSFISANREKLQLEKEVFSDYYKTHDGTYIVNMQIYDENILLFEMAVPAPDMQSAHILASNWQRNAVNIYKTINISLMQDEKG